MELKFIKSKTFKIAVSVVFTALCVWLIFEIVDFEYFFKSLKTINFWWLFPASFSLLVSYFFRVLRYEQILEQPKSKLKIFAISTIHYFLNKILPARTGEISLPILLKNHLNFNYAKGIAALLFVRVLDFFAMIFLLLIASLIVSSEHINPIIVGAFAFLALLGFAIVWVFLDKIITLTLKIFAKFNIKKLQKIKGKIIELLEFISNYKQNKKPIFVARAIFISIFNWIAIYFYYHFIILAFSQSQNYFETLFAATVSNFTFMLPISAIGNIGPFEGAWAIGFYLVGVAKEISVPIGLFANIFATLFTALLALVGFAILRKK